MPTKFDHEVYLTKLRRELRRLENAPESIIARRNARRRMLTALRNLRTAVDKQYPAIIDRKGVKRLKTFAGRLARMRRAGWVELGGPDAAGRYAAAGVPVRKLEHTDDGDAARGRPGEHHRVWLAPAWAVAIGFNEAHLRAAKKSRSVRAAAIVAKALS